MRTSAGRPAVRHVHLTGITGLCVTGLAVLAGCSSPSPEAPAGPQQLNQSLADTTWSGTCAGFEIGTYTFEFGPGGAEGGTVKVGFPDAAKGTQTVRYSTPGGQSGEQLLAMELDPPWNGSFDLDRENLRWDPRLGDTGAPAQCFLKQSGPAAGR